MDVPRTLLVTNDYPPRIGGIQRTLHALMGALPHDRVHVFASAWDGAASFDAGEPYPIARSSRPFVWPTPVARRRIHDIVEESGAEVVLFRPDVPSERIRERHDLAGRPLVVCVSRLVPRKGHDVLIRALPEIRRRVPDAALLLVGEGSYRPALEAMAARSSPGSVVFAGAASEQDLPSYYRAGDVFAMPCRTRLGGLEVEGWGNVFIEAAACGRPVVVGDSGGARESVVDGETGLLVDGSDVGAVAEAVASLLEDPGRAEAMGSAGRARVERDHAWPAIAERLARWLRAAVDGV